MGTCLSKEEEEDPLYHVSKNSDNDLDDIEGAGEKQHIDQYADQYAEGDFIPKTYSQGYDDLFKGYGEIAEKENQRRTTVVNEQTDIFSRNDIKSLPNVEGTYGRVDNEESGEYIISYLSRQEFYDQYFIPSVICDLIIKFIDMVFQSRWSSKHKGPDFRINVINKCKASIPNTFNVIKQGIRALNSCLRSKVSVFYVRFNRIKSKDSIYNSLTKYNFIGIIPQFIDTFNAPLPKIGYGIVWEPNWIYVGNTKIGRNGKRAVGDNQTIKCVVDLREDMNIVKFLWDSGETVINLPNPKTNDEYKEMKWYPFISGDFTDTSCIIEFDTFDTINNGPPSPPLPPSLPIPVS